VNDDRYGSDVLAGDWKKSGSAPIRRVEAVRDVVLEDAATGFCGAVLHVENSAVHLEDRHGAVRAFPLGRGFLLDGAPIDLIPPARRGATGAGSPGRTASGSFSVPEARARVARASRIFVEGRHDAELVERVWGDDLRIEGVVVEYLEGVDDLEGLLADFGPTASRRVGVLVDHLVPGSKESRIAERVRAGKHGAHVLVVGHPFVDVWQAVRPERLGRAAWPAIPRSVEWKHGICDAFGWPHESQADIARAWQRILSRVSSYADLEPALLGRVEELIDFVTAP
jgi:hypothetical protein